jgi:putative endonuclease
VTPRALVDRILEAVGLSRGRSYRGLRGVGQSWERLAAKRLEAEGYAVRDRNFRASAGEIDFVAEEKGILCFVEVKGRRGTAFGAPAEAVTLEKQRRIARAAEEYLRRRRLGDVPCRFDVVAILESGGKTDVTILRGAFDRPDARGPRR